MKSAKGAQGLQRAHKEMRLTGKWQLVDGQFNGELPVLILWEQKNTLTLW